ncbi:MAG: polyisoprenoid-binding protein YceI [Nonlabens sp.]|jgi:polyisoprenoid-binding protein YceI|uniref:YceI family protein n=1 Tax=Nonlabens sp. TaxID=1888209 RepID=UPI0039E6629C
MKCLFPFLVLITVLHTHAQKHVTKTGTISFEGSVETFQPIKATNESTTVVLDNKGNLAALVLIKGFRFPVALMQEHFNENYMESDDFPNATLRGKFANYDTFVSDGSTQTLQFIGTLEMHGIKKELEIPIELTYTAAGYKLLAEFKLNPSDYNIDIPSIVSKKIADKITVVVKAVMTE